MKQIVEQYFINNPILKNEVIKASYAYSFSSIMKIGDHRWPRFPHVETNLLLDVFEHLRHDNCMTCGRSRWQVRYDNLSPECSQWKSIDIEKTILNEEQAFFDLIEKSESIVITIIRKKGLSGETLAYLHHTHGIDIETVETYIDLTQELRNEYNIAWEQHCATGGKIKD